MIKVYYLPVKKESNTEKVLGSEYIHRAYLLATENPNIRKLIMDTTSMEDTALTVLATKVEMPTINESLMLANLPPLSLPARDLAAEVDSIKSRLGKLES